jgi:hypothetical protein
MFCGYCGKENAKDYSFCSGCGKPLEKGAHNHSIKPENTFEENTDTNSFKDSSPRSKYISVNWWKDCEWPWQASSLSGEVLGTYKTEIEAAMVVAKYHEINTDDLLISLSEDTVFARLELEEKKRLLIKRVLENSNKKTEQSIPPKVQTTLEDEGGIKKVLESSNRETKKSVPPKVPSEDYLSFDSPDLESPPAPPPKKSLPPQSNMSDKIREAVEEQKYYVDQFVPFYETGQGIKSWNWAAFLIGPIWCLYRKVYSLFFVYTISYTVSFWVEKINMSDLTQFYINLLSMIAVIQVAREANRTYYHKVLKRIKENKKE